MNARCLGFFLPHRHIAPVRSRRRRAGCFTVSSRISALAAALLLAAAGSVLAVPAVTFTVDTTQDTEPVAPVLGAKDAAGHTSLRAALMAANVSPGTAPVTINFNIPGGGAPQIGLGSLLPEIVHPIALNAATQPGLSAGQRVGLAPQAGVSLEYGLFIVGGRSVVTGLNIEGFSEGILIQVLGSNAVQGCRFANNGIGLCIGTYRGNDPSGGSFANLIGGLTPERKNIFVSNTLCGILTFWSQSNVIAGNLIGVEEGYIPGGNQFGIMLLYSDKNVIGGKVPGSGNVISNSLEDGVFMAGCQKNFIYGNLVNFNERHGVVLCSAPATDSKGAATFRHSIANRIGASSLDGTGNFISGNLNIGIVIACDADVLGSNKVQGNNIGTDATGTTAVSNGGGVSIFGSSLNLVGGKTPGSRNIISANEGVGVGITGYALTLNELLTGDPPALPVYLSALLNVVEGNLIGAGASRGNTGLGNGLGGVEILGASRSIIGGTTPATGNIIANNAGLSQNGAGVRIVNATSGGNILKAAVQNQIIGNTIEHNLFYGVRLESDTVENIVGGRTKGMGNQIIDNGQDDGGFDGVSLAERSKTGVLGNSIARNGNDHQGGGGGGGRLFGIESQASARIALTSVEQTSGKTRVKWTLTDNVYPPGTLYRIEFFSNSAVATAQGETYLGNESAKLGDNLTATGDFLLPKSANFITATATVLGPKKTAVITSNFSNVAEVPAAVSASP